jgi:hypothetical protein
MITILTAVAVFAVVVAAAIGIMSWAFDRWPDQFGDDGQGGQRP